MTTTTLHPEVSISRQKAIAEICPSYEIKPMQAAILLGAWRSGGFRSTELSYTTKVDAR
jgi:hypothetical protein